MHCTGRGLANAGVLIDFFPHQRQTIRRGIVFLAAAAVLSFATIAATAQTLKVANPNEQGDGTLGAAAARAIAHGPLPFSDADVAAKAAADRAHDKAARSSRGDPTGNTQKPRAPIVQGGLNFAGQTDTSGSPPDTTGAVGFSRYIQLVNRRAGIFNRTTGALIGSGFLNDLAGVAAGVNSFDPQVIWDGQMNRFFYVMDSIFSSSDNRLSFGFSKTASPVNVTTDWCHYTLAFGTRFPDYPKLGDSAFFTIIGVNSFAPGFVGSDLIAISKPAAGTTCPLASSFKIGVKQNLVDTTGAQVFTPVPAQQVDTSATGYVVARNGGLPSTRLWFFNVTRNPATLLPVFGAARGVTVASYTVPPNATQPTFTQLLDTLDARNTQAVQATNPDRGTFSFWTQHTIANGSLSGVRWYEINPVPAVPVVLRTANIQNPTSFFFNAAISPDRKRLGATVQFGDSFVIEYNVSGSASGISPNIVAGSSFSGGPLSFSVVKPAVGPYRDFTCQSAGSICRWGDYSSATPDPNPPASRPRLDRGEVWGTNQFSGVVSPPPAGVNWRTQIFALQP
jgi:hypothetical protein